MVKLGRAGRAGRSGGIVAEVGEVAVSGSGGDANCARATSTAVKRDAILFSNDVIVAAITSTFKSTNVSRMVSSIPSNHCETVWAVVTVWSRMVVRVDAISDELEPTSEHNSTHRVILGSWASIHSKEDLHPIHPFTLLHQLCVAHMVTLGHLHQR